MKPRQSPDDIYKKQDRPSLGRRKGRKGRRRAVSPLPGQPQIPSRRKSNARAKGERGTGMSIGIVLVLVSVMLAYVLILVLMRGGGDGNEEAVAKPTAVPANTPNPQERVAATSAVPEQVETVSIADSLRANIAAWAENRDNMTRVQVSVRREELARALEVLESVQHKTPEWYRLNRRIAELTFGRENYVHALERLKEVIPVDPDVFELRGMLAVCLLETGDVEAAEVAGRWALELSPFNSEMHQVVADSLTRRGHLENALPHLRKIAESATFDLGKQIQYAEALDLSGRYSRAVTIFEKTLQQNPKHAQTYYSFASCHVRNDKGGLAIKLLQTAVEKCGREFVAQWLSGGELMVLKEHADFPLLRPLLSP